MDDLSLPLDLYQSYPELASARVAWNRETGQLEAVRGLLTEPSSDSPEQIAGSLLERYARLLGKDEGSVLDDLQLVQVQQGPAGHTVRYLQYVQGIPVFGSLISVHLTRRGQAYRMSSGYRPGAAKVNVVQGRESAIKESQACQIAVTEMRGKNSLCRTPQAGLVIYALDETDYLAWQVSVTTEAPVRVWTVFVDSRTGRVLDQVPSLVPRTK